MGEQLTQGWPLSPRFSPRHDTGVVTSLLQGLLRELPGRCALPQGPHDKVPTKAGPAAPVTAQPGRACVRPHQRDENDSFGHNKRHWRRGDPGSRGKQFTEASLEMSAGRNSEDSGNGYKKVNFYRKR